MECTVSWTGASGTRSGMGFVAETGSGHILAMDGAPDEKNPDNGGRNLAPRPMEALLAGTGGSWPAITSFSQPMVEAASIAIGLHLTKDQLWDTLDQAGQDQVAAWLAGSARSDVGKNNWVLFPMVIAEFLAGAGYPHNEERVVQGLAGLEKWYVGGGWYRDGDGDFFDYYGGWAMHLYPQLWLRMLAERDPERAALLRPRFAARLAEFLPDHTSFFGGNGAPVYHGRSLIYRYAAVAPLFAAELAGIPSPLAPGQLRRIGSGALKLFAEGGAYSGVAEAPGVPTLGWQGEFLPMVQSYSGPASPFWTSKAFVALLLPADHPVWTAVEESSPVEQADRTRVAAAPNFLLASTANDGIARVLNHGSDKYYGPGRENVEYARLAYSSHTAPLYGPDGPVDNHIALLDGAGRQSERMRIHRLPADAQSVASFHRPVWDGADEAESPWRISTATTTSGGYELRVHVAEHGGTAETFHAATVQEGGYAVAAESPVPTATAPEGNGGACVHSGELHSTIWPLAGYESAACAAYEGASPMGRHASVPFLEGTLRGRRTVFASLVHLSNEQSWTSPVSVDVLDNGHSVKVAASFPDGSELATTLHA